MITTDRCPAEERLAAFDLGELPEPDLVAVSDHVAGCASCEARLGEMERRPDGVIRALRRPAVTPDGATVNVRAPTDTRPSGESGPGQAGLPHVPGYEVLSPLGEGGMGVVYKARHLQLGRLVALKLIRGAKPDRVARFRAEAQAGARLSHPNVVQTFEVGEYAGQPYLALELVEGGTLAERLGGKPWMPRQAAETALTLARAVAHAHERGVVHRDLKPANVLLDEAGTPKVADFGLAKRLDAEAGQTEAGDILGTPNYMAPEQASGQAKDVGPPADIYALGAILYEMLTGRPPFQGDGPLETLQQVRTLEPVRPRALRPGVPRDLETVCLECLHKEPARRYKSAESLAEDLRRYLAGEPILARPVGAAESALKWARRHPAMLAAYLLAGLVLVVGGLGGGAYRLWREAEDSGQRALAAKVEAEEARDGERSAKDELDQTLYLRRVSLALAEWRVGDPLRGARLLAECPPGRRGWEWRYAHRLCGVCPLTIDADDKAIFSLAYSPDGRRLATVAVDGTGVLWDAATGEPKLTFVREGRTIPQVAFSPDGQRIATAGRDGVVRLRDAFTGALARSLGESGGKALTGLAFSPDGRRLAAVSSDHSFRVWDTQADGPPVTLRGHAGPIHAVSWGTGGHLATGGFDRCVKVWDAATGQCLRTLSTHPEPVFRVAGSADGKRLAAVTWQGTLKVWDAADGKELFSGREHTGIVGGVAFSPGGKRIYTAGRDRALKVWDAESFRVLATWRGHLQQLTGLAVAPDGGRLATGDSTGSVRVWDARAGKELFRLPHHGIAHRVAYSPDGKLLVTAVGGGKDAGKITVWDAETGRELLARQAHGGYIADAAFGPAGRLATVGGDGAVRLWDAPRGRELVTIPVQKDALLSVALSPDGRLVAAGGFGGALKVWDAGDGREVLALAGHARDVAGLAFSPAGDRLVSAGRDGVLKVWDARDGRLLLILRGHFGSAHRVAYSPDGGRIVSAGEDGTVALWDAATGQETALLRGHAGEVRDVSFSPDGDRVASVGADGTVRVWQAGRGGDQ